MTTYNPRPVFEHLRSRVVPSVEDYWRADAVITTFLDRSLPGFSGDNADATCGIAALSAFFGAGAASRATSGFTTPWINRRMMELALRNLGVNYEKLRGKLPHQGVSLIQWEGAWSSRDYRGKNLAYTHWVAVIDNYVFDVNWPGWLPMNLWESTVAEVIIADQKATGWSVMTSYAI